MSNTLETNIDTTNTDTTNNPTYNPFYKVNYLVNGMIDTVFVFYGKKIVPEDQMSIIQKIFTEEEITIIDRDNIDVRFLEEQIHFDDTIGTIKLKILEQFKKQDVF
jgi:hypothetical protein